jgi:lysophospholipase L1-like esterase
MKTLFVCIIATLGLCAQNPARFEGDLKLSPSIHGSTLSSKSLVVAYDLHDSAVNLVQYSEQLDNTAFWNVVGVDSGSVTSTFAPVVTADAATAPDGTGTAERIDYHAIGASNSLTGLYHSFSGTDWAIGDQIVVSVYLKGVPGVSDSGTLYLFDSADAINYHYQTCSYTSARWTRCVLYSAAFANGTDTFQLGVDTRGSSTMAFQPAQSVYAWGFSLMANQPQGFSTNYRKVVADPIFPDQSGNGLDLVTTGPVQLNGDSISNATVHATPVVLPSGNFDWTMQVLASRAITPSGDQYTLAVGNGGVANGAIMAAVDTNGFIQLCTGSNGCVVSTLTWPVVPTVVTLRYTASTQAFEVIRGTDFKGKYSTTLPSPYAMNGGDFISAGFAWGGSFYSAALWSRKFSDDEVARQGAALARHLQNRFPKHYTHDGDSLTFGLGLTTAQSYPRQLMSLQHASHSFVNLGISGQQVCTSIDANFASRMPYSPATTSRNYYILLGGINDLYWATTPADTYTCLKSVWAKARAQGYKVVAMTLTGTGNVDYSLVTSLNTLIRSDASLYDALVDLGADSNLGCNGCWTNGTYYQGDLVHYNATGAGVLASKVATAINSLP